MNRRAGKTQDKKNQSVAHEAAQKNHSSTSIFQFVDNRPETIVQRKIQEGANNSPQVRQLKAFQEMADNGGIVQAKEIHSEGEKGNLSQAPFQLFANSSNLPIQRFIGADGTNQEGHTIPFTLDQEFNDKHVAADEAGAIANTQARIDNDEDLGGQMIQAGNIGNTVATNAVWTAAINGNGDVIPADFNGPDDADKAEPDYNAADYNDSGYSGNSSYMAIGGWDVKLEDGSLIASQATMNRKVAGTYNVANLDVSIDINHCTQ